MPRKPAPSLNVYAVITGDIVGSTKLSPKRMAGVRATIVKSVRDYSLRRFEHCRAPEFFQGDSWQLPLDEPRWALPVALLIQARLLAEQNVSTRAAIGIGTVDELGKTAAISTGDAFTLSGRALQAMPSAFRLTGALSHAVDAPPHIAALAKWFPGILHMCSALMRGWTQRQAEVISLWLSLPVPNDESIASQLVVTKLQSPTYESIANELTIAKQSVGDILASANLPALREAMTMLHATDWQCIANSETERNA
jgi:hypothetical protein